MERKLTAWMGALQERQTLEALEHCNELTAPLGLHLSLAEMEDLARARGKALRDSGRVEFGGGILPRLIQAFYDSPWLDGAHYAETLDVLQESFYYFKTESMGALDDGELLDWMRRYFDGVCAGSLELLCGTTLDELCRSARHGFHPPEDIRPDGFGECWNDGE